MSLRPMNAGQTRARLVEAVVALAAAALFAGCGSGYRPVVTPVSPSGPAAQPSSLAVVVSSPSPTAAGVATIIDYSGDTVMATAPIGPGPTNFTVDAIGGDGYTINSDHTLTNFPVSTALQAKSVTYSTLSTNPAAQPVGLFSPSSGLWIADLTGNVADVLTGIPESFKLSIPVAPTPITVVGPAASGGQRNYVISQLLDSNGIDCNNSPTTGAIGAATPIEIANNSPDAVIPVGKCPVYAVQSSDNKRLFVLNRGDDTITVINSVNNTLDSCTPFTEPNTGQLVTCHPTLPLSTTAGLAQNASNAVPSIAGPVDAEYNAATNQLVVADYDGGTISIIDVTVDEYGNDYNTYDSNGNITGGFGTTYTVKVGNTLTPYPASVTVLYDGSRAYTANQGDCTPDCVSTPNGTVSVVNLSSHVLEKTLPVTGLPRTVVSTENSEYGKVYVASPDSPYLTIISTGGTDPDVIDTTVLVEGNIVDVRVSTQNGVSGNSNTTSRAPGYGQPCYLPPTILGSTTLATCKTLP